jgi:hypothetical protein
VERRGATNAQLEDFAGLMRRLWRGACALSGRAFDQIVLHTFFTDETVDRCVRAARTAAEQAGADPAAVKVWSVYATVPGDVTRETYLGRVAALQAFRADPVVAGFGRTLIDAGGPGLPGRRLRPTLPLGDQPVTSTAPFVCADLARKAVIFAIFPLVVPSGAA